jgi:uncharacterized protein YprB with RNaseH-like and TPR domain
VKRDLTARLREIIKQPVGRASAPPRELTLEPTLEMRSGLFSAAARADKSPDLISRFGGVFLDEQQHVVVIDYVYESTRSHGRWPIDAARPRREAPLDWFDPAACAGADWSLKPVFFDTETTGLSGGAGTLAFLTGCGWFEPEGFRVRQWLLLSQAGEPAMLAALGRVVDDTTLLVSYNGRSFDVPLMNMRWAFHRQQNPFDDVPHFDMLPTARRLWRQREGAFDENGDSGCSLSTLERDVLGFHRDGDVPGFEIPSRYFHFLRTGDASALTGVLDHHRHDIVSLAVLMSHALRIAEHGPDMCRDDHELVALGKLYERAEQPARARAAFERASLSADRYVRAQAFSRLGLMHRRDGNHDEAANAWKGVIEAAGGRRSLFALERAATEALAIHHEHRARDFDEAKRYAETMRAQSSGRAASDAAHRLARLERKLSEGKKKGDPKVARLLE